MTTTEKHAAELTQFIDEIDAQVSTWRMDLCTKWGGTDALPLYPTDGDLPTTTVGAVRAVLDGYKQARVENWRLQEEAVRRRIRLGYILARLVVSIAIATVLWVVYALLLGESARTYEILISVSLGSALGQGLLWWDQRRESQDG